MGSQEFRQLWRTWPSFTNFYAFMLTTLWSAALFSQQVVSDSVQTVSGVLYAENFTYYKLSGEGWLRLELHSLKGDVDLYVSGTTLHPTFTDYELKSDSCGVEIVDIHSFMSRPIGIGLYAHPFHFQSSYKLDIKVITEVEVDEYEQLFQRFHYFDHDYDDDYSKDNTKGKSRTNRKSPVQDNQQEEEEESIWWVILMTVLKFVFEIIV
ncbi:UPF0669 protein C6orf120 homolog [Littorina saxatilis]|uniref:Uncharacterized protein n=1 Tax=Littorina saxatilis TaxID=31220 RepID=A0AAN9BFH4_9CAEN